jgi:hypothetical protein
MADNTQLGIKAVQFGQAYREIDGTEQIAGQDMILITTIQDGRALSTVQLAPESALLAARALTTAAARLIGNRVDDNGRRGGLRAYLAATRPTKETP